MNLQSLSDEELRDIIVNERPGWDEAYKVLFIERYGGVVRKIVTRFSPQQLGLEKPEGIHSALLEHLRGENGAWGRLRSWNPARGRFGPWLQQVVWNLCRDLARRESRDPRVISLDEPQPGSDGSEITLGDLTPDPRPGPEELIMDQEMWDCLQKALDCLQKALEQLAREDPKGHHIIQRSFFYKWTDTKIADSLGVRRETVNRRKQEAIRRLRTIMNECLGGAP